MVTMLAPLACATGMRQLFTSMPSNNTEQEPHSPSPHPSFAPINPRSFRSTSNNLSIGCASTFFASPLTANNTSHFALFCSGGFMQILGPEKKHLAQETLVPDRPPNLPPRAEWSRSERPSRLPRRLESQ